MGPHLASSVTRCILDVPKKIPSPVGNCWDVCQVIDPRVLMRLYIEKHVLGVATGEKHIEAQG